MSDDIVRQLSNAARTANAVGAQGGGGSPSANPEGAGGQQDPPQIDLTALGFVEQEMVEGLKYSVPVVQAATLGWALAPPEAGVGNAKRVFIEPAFETTHRYVKIAQLPTEYDDIVLQGFDKESFTLIMANAIDMPEGFAEE